MTEDIEPMSVSEFMIAVLQVAHNKQYPKHRCDCKNIYAMATKHFETHLKEIEK